MLVSLTTPFLPSYLLIHSNMPGLSSDDQRMLAAVVGAHRRKLPDDPFELLTRKHGEVYIVLAYRNDSAHWRKDGERSAEFLASLRHEPELLVDRSPTSIDRIRIWRLDRNSARR